VSDINRVELRGRAPADAEVKHLRTATLTTLRIGTDGSYTGSDGKEVERTDWHLVACWGEVGEAAANIRKGDTVTVVGQLRTRSYNDKAGAKRYVTEVVAKSVVVDAQDRQPKVERDDTPDRSEDDIPF
jgi:single-strand DNA-binding protein